MRHSIILFLCFFIHTSCQTVEFAPDPSQNFGALAIMQGVTTPTQSQFVISLPKEESVQIEVFEEKGRNPLQSVAIKEIVREDSQWKLVQLTVNGLKVNKSYRLKVSSIEKNWSDLRYFKTTQLVDRHSRMIVVSCMRDDMAGTELIWDEVKKAEPDYLLMIGDNSYTDLKVDGVIQKMSASLLWQRHMETRNQLSPFRWQNLVPVFATWDDHDYGINNGDKNFPLKEESQNIFLSFFPSELESPFVKKGPGVAFSLQLGFQSFHFLDNRSFRLPNDQDGLYAHFGKKQELWLIQNLSRQNLNWVISGDQFFGGYHPYDSYQGLHPQGFQYFLKQLATEPSPLWFISGDRHMSELIKIPTKKYSQGPYELTSSPIHSSVYPGASYQYKNPFRLHGLSGKWNFAQVDVTPPSGPYYRLKIKVVDKKGQGLFEENIKIPR